MLAREARSPPAREGSERKRLEGGVSASTVPGMPPLPPEPSLPPRARGAHGGAGGARHSAAAPGLSDAAAAWSVRVGACGVRHAAAVATAGERERAAADEAVATAARGVRGGAESVADAAAAVVAADRGVHGGGRGAGHTAAAARAAAAAARGACGTECGAVAAAARGAYVGVCGARRAATAARVSAAAARVVCGGELRLGWRLGAHGLRGWQAWCMGVRCRLPVGCSQSPRSQARQQRARVRGRRPVKCQAMSHR